MVRIEDRSDPDPANWAVSERAAGVINDRDFSAGDFIEVYAPRAAVYEALPGFLLRLSGGGFPGERVLSPGSPLWARLSGGLGSYEAERASVGAEYDSSRFAAEAGLDFSLDENATGSVSVRQVRGRADVSAPTGGGKIEADGIGVTLGLSVYGANAYYARGRVSLTSYAADLSSNDLGPLKAGVDARAHALDFESGRRMTIGEKVNLTPRVRLSRTGVDVDNFADAVDSRVSVGDAARFTGSLGVAVEDGARPDPARPRVLPARLGGSRADPQGGGDERRRVGREAFFRVGQDPPPVGSGREVPPRAPRDRGAGLLGRPGFGRCATRRSRHVWIEFLEKANALWDVTASG